MTFFLCETVTDWNEKKNAVFSFHIYQFRDYFVMCGCCSDVDPHVCTGGARIQGYRCTWNTNLTSDAYDGCHTSPNLLGIFCLNAITITATCNQKFIGKKYF